MSKCWSALDFFKNRFKKMETDEIHFWSISNSNFAGYAASKNQVWKRVKVEFVELHFLKLVIISNTCVVFLITEIFWQTFCRNERLSVFDVVKNSNLCFKIFCCEYVTTLATVKCKCILLQLLVLSKACFTQSLTVMRILPLVFIIIVSMSNGKNLLWRDDKIFNVVRFPVCHIYHE